MKDDEIVQASFFKIDALIGSAVKETNQNVTISGFPKSITLGLQCGIIHLANEALTKLCPYHHLYKEKDQLLTNYLPVFQIITPLCPATQKTITY